MMIAPPGVMGRVVPSPSSSSASEGTTAIAGRSSLRAPATSPIVAANKTSCPNPISVCASPSRSATSAPTRITFATTEFPSFSQPLNRLQVDPAYFDHFGSRGVAGHDAHITPRSFQGPGKKIDQCLVRHSVYWWSCHPHLQGNPVQTDDLIP